MMKHRYGSGPLPGPGDPETWGPPVDPRDPRYEEPPEDDDEEELW